MAFWLSAWMDDHGVGFGALDGGLLDLFAAGVVPATPGRSMALGRIPVVRRFLLAPRSPSRRAAARNRPALLARNLMRGGPGSATRPQSAKVSFVTGAAGQAASSPRSPMVMPSGGRMPTSRW